MANGVMEMNNTEQHETSTVPDDRAKRRPIEPEDRVLGQRIKNRREALGLSQAQVAERMGKHTDRAVGHWESGYARISAIDLQKLARVLACPAAYFTSEDAYVPTEEDREWLGFLGRTIARVKQGHAREILKRQVIQQVELQADMLQRLIDEDPNRQ